jgi:hypothetical protein
VCEAICGDITEVQHRLRLHAGSNMHMPCCLQLHGLDRDSCPPPHFDEDCVEHNCETPEPRGLVAYFARASVQVEAWLNILQCEAAVSWGNMLYTAAAVPSLPTRPSGSHVKQELKQPHTPPCSMTWRLSAAPIAEEPCEVRRPPAAGVHAGHNDATTLGMAPTNHPMRRIKHPAAPAG